MRLAVWARSIVQPIALFGGLGLAAWWKPGAAAASVAILAANVVTCAFIIATHGGVISRAAALRVAFRGPFDSALLRYGRQLVLSGLAVVVLTRLDVFFLGRYADSTSVGILAASLVFAGGIAQLRGALDVPLIALMSRALVDNDGATLNTLLRRFTRWALLLTVPVAVVFGGLADLLLSLLGHDFAVGGSALCVLLVGQLCVAASIAGVYVAISGRVYVVALVAAGAAAIELVLLVALVPRYGFFGAAIASTVAAASNALALMFITSRAVGASPFERHALHPLLAGVAAAWIAHALAHASAWPLSLRVGAALIASGVVYVVGVTALGLHAEDRALVSAVLARRR
jgi:O-antigen/teichoic acid export membrane protein